MSNTDATTAPEVSAPSPDQQAVEPQNVMSNINIKLPPFWANDPQIWFVQTEAYFATRRITSQKTMYQVVVSSLDPQYAVEIRDLLLHPPIDNQYDKLKEALLARTQRSEQARLRELLSPEELGDHPPSAALRRMQQLLGDKLVDSSLLRKLFVQRLPPSMRVVLASTPASVSLHELAQLANKVAETTTPQLSQPSRLARSTTTSRNCDKR